MRIRAFIHEVGHKLGAGLEPDPTEARYFVGPSAPARAGETPALPDPGAQASRLPVTRKALPYLLAHMRHAGRFLGRSGFYISFVAALWFASVLLFPPGASAEEPTATPTETPAPPRYFSSQLQVKPVSTPVGPLQDVAGKVVAKSGGGIDGVRVRASSSNWQAFEATRDGGAFKFALTNGTYTIRLVDMAAGEVEIKVDGKSELLIEFREVDSSTPVSPTPSPTVSSPTATATATETPTPSATPYPTSTPLSLPETVDETPPLEATALPATSFLPFAIEVDPAPWLRIFLYGAASGGALVFFGLLVALVRRL